MRDSDDGSSWSISDIEIDFIDYKYYDTSVYACDDVVGHHSPTARQFFGTADSKRFENIEKAE